MDAGDLHVAAACAALGVGLLVIVRGKGGAVHVAMGRVFLATMVLVNVPALLRYEETGGPGPFHVLAVLSLMTTTLGWLSVRRRPRSTRVVRSHAAFMVWSWMGVVTAGLAQLGNQLWPEQTPWPVVAVVVLASGVGLIWVPRYVARQLSADAAGRPMPARRSRCPCGSPGRTPW